MRLGAQQELFAQLYAALIQRAFFLGFTVRLGETERPREMAEIYAAQGKGIASSLHTKRLAGDLHLFRDGVYLTSTEDYRELGEWWEQQHELCRWGGRFDDGCHFSLERDGIK